MNLRAIFVSLFLFFFASTVLAAAVVQSVSGDVRISVAGAESALSNRQSVDSGATINTGSAGNAVLRFDDGQMAALSPNTSFKIDNYRFEAAKPEQGSVAMSLLKGALRMVTGLIGQRNHSNFALHIPTATIGIRGTDFMVAIANSDYTSVIDGSISVTNSAGTVDFAAGDIGMVSSTSTLATSISATALPATVGATFSQLGALPLAGAAAGAAGASAATAASAGAISGGTVAAMAVGVAAVAAGASNNSSNNTATATTTQ